LAGNITVSGLIKELQAHRNQLQIINGELEKVLNKKKEKMLQEADVIELFDGTEFGKRTMQDKACVKPVVWAMLGAQLPVYVREMSSSESNGRLRFVMISIDSAQVQKTVFEDKLVPRKHSDHLLTEVLRMILRMQQSEMPESRVQPHVPASPAMATQDADSERPAKRIRIRQGSASHDLAEPQAQPPRHMKVPTMIWSASATLVLAGMQDGSGNAAQTADSSQGSSVITKHAGKAFGAIATANVAMRNGLLHFALGAQVPPDSQVRGLDALAAIPRTEICSVNQFLAERHIQQKHHHEKKHGDNPVEEKEEIPNLEPIEFASRRLFDGLASTNKDDGSHLLEAADLEGIPFKVNARTEWYNFRQLHFSRSRKRQQGVLVLECFVFMFSKLTSNPDQTYITIQTS